MIDPLLIVVFAWFAFGLLVATVFGRIARGRRR